MSKLKTTVVLLHKVWQSMYMSPEVDKKVNKSIVDIPRYG